jgi:chorismate mutase
MELTRLRGQIDQIDDQLVALFVQRMEVSAAIARYKQEYGMPIHVPAREQEKLAAVAQKSGDEMAAYTQELYKLLFELSRSYQTQLTGREEVL